MFESEPWKYGGFTKVNCVVESFVHSTGACRGCQKHSEYPCHLDSVAEDVDAVLISHADLSHLGGLPYAGTCTLRIL